MEQLGSSSEIIHGGMLFGDGVVNARGVGYDYINVRGRFAFIYQSLLVTEVSGDRQVEAQKQ